MSETALVAATLAVIQRPKDYESEFVCKFSSFPLSEIRVSVVTLQSSQMQRLGLITKVKFHLLFHAAQHRVYLMLFQ